MQAAAGGISAEHLAGMRRSVPTLRVAVLGQQLSLEDFDALLQVRRRLIYTARALDGLATTRGAACDYIVHRRTGRGGITNAQTCYGRWAGQVWSQYIIWNTGTMQY